MLAEHATFATHSGVLFDSGSIGRSALTPIARRRALPILEGPMERIYILVTQQIRHFRQTRVGVSKQLLREFAPGLDEQDPKRCAIFSDTTLQGAVAHTQLAGDLRQLGPAT